MHVLSFDGNASSFAKNEEKVILWNQISTVGPQERDANLLLHMTDIERNVCMSVGKDHIGNSVRPQQISRTLRGRFAPDATDAIYQDVAKFMNFKRVDQTVDTYLMEFDVMREKAEARMGMGHGFPDEFASVLCVQNAALLGNGKSMGLACVQNNLAFPGAPSLMRRLFGPRGSAVRQDVLAAADLGPALGEEDYAAWVAYRKARKGQKRERRRSDRRKTARSRPRGEGRAMNGFNRKTGESDGRYTCNREFHYAPDCPNKDNRSGGPSP